MIDINRTIPLACLVATCICSTGYAQSKPERVMSAETAARARGYIQRSVKEPESRDAHLENAVLLGSTEAMWALGNSAKKIHEKATWYRMALTSNGKERRPSQLDTPYIIPKYGDAALFMARWAKKARATKRPTDTVGLYLSIAVNRGALDASLPFARLLVATGVSDKQVRAAKVLAAFIRGQRLANSRHGDAAEAAYFLALLYREGPKPIRQGPDAALEMFALAGAWGELRGADAAGQMLVLGGGGVAVDIKRGLPLLELAARGTPRRTGMISAKLALAGALSEGKTLRADPPRAASLYVQAAWLTAEHPRNAESAKRIIAQLPALSERFAEADLEFQIAMMRHCDHMVALFQVLSDKENAAADTDSEGTERMLQDQLKSSALASAYLGLVLAKTDPARARALLKSACEDDYPVACDLLSKWNLEGKYGKKDAAAAREYAKHCAVIYARLGLLDRASALMPRIDKSDTTEVIRWVRLAEEGGFAHGFLPTTERTPKSADE